VRRGVLLEACHSYGGLVHREQLDQIPEDVDPPVFGNSKYHITFEDRHHRPDYGWAYRFYLEDAVDDVPEYVVKWDLFESLAGEYGLKLVYNSTFGDLFFSHKEDPQFKSLMQRMRVVNEFGDSDLDEETWDAASRFSSLLSRRLLLSFWTDLYVCFAFTKV
jgi:mRNA (guanine-N7-)-methyltransferase